MSQPHAAALFSKAPRLTRVTSDAFAEDVDAVAKTAGAHDALYEINLINARLPLSERIDNRVDEGRMLSRHAPEALRRLERMRCQRQT